MNRQTFIDFARSTMGTRYLHQGRLPGVGLDCGGVVLCAAIASGGSPDDIAGYKRLADGDSIERAVAPYCDVITPKEAFVPGDVLVFAWERRGQHLAVCTADDVIVHAHTAVGRVVEHRMDAQWRGLHIRTYRPHFES